LTFVSELRAALDSSDQENAAENVHHLVANALSRLDSGVEVKRTDYFTHTIVPDLILRWGSHEPRQERHVHLRFSISAESFAQDLELLASDAPLFIGMTDPDHELTPTASKLPVKGSLVTKSQAVEALDNKVGKDARARKATSVIVRVGRGVIERVRAEEVSSDYLSALGAIGTVGGEIDGARSAVKTALSTLDTYLDDEGRIEVERALQAEWIRSGGDPYEFPGKSPWNPELLDVASLREVLLSLLAAEVPAQPETWQRNAGFIRIEDLGRILGGNFRGDRFNRMAHALMANWTAKWVWSERLPSPPLIDTYEWLIDSGVVGLEVNDLRTFFADDGRHFKDKDGGNPLPLLSDAQQMLSQPGLQEVGLRGPQEGIRYEPLGSTSSVFNRMQQILTAPGAGDYRVQSLVAAVPSTDAVAQIDLDRQVIDLSGHSTPVSTLARMASRFFSRASRPEGLDHFLATGEIPPTRHSDPDLP
jgi:hypothetical protein